MALIHSVFIWWIGGRLNREEKPVRTQQTLYLIKQVSQRAERFANVFDNEKQQLNALNRQKRIFAFSIHDSTYLKFGLASHVYSKKLSKSNHALALKL